MPLLRLYAKADLFLEINTATDIYRYTDERTNGSIHGRIDGRTQLFMFIFITGHINEYTCGSYYQVPT